jgi:hypothetical protein
MREKSYQQFYAVFDKYLKEKTGIREIGIAINTGTSLLNIIVPKRVKGKRENCCDTLAGSFKVLIESKVVKNSQFPLPFNKSAEIDVEFRKR